MIFTKEFDEVIIFGIPFTPNFSRDSLLVVKSISKPESVILQSDKSIFFIALFKLQIFTKESSLTFVLLTLAFVNLGHFFKKFHKSTISKIIGVRKTNFVQLRAIVRNFNIGFFRHIFCRRKLQHLYIGTILSNSLSDSLLLKNHLIEVP